MDNSDLSQPRHELHSQITPSFFELSSGKVGSISNSSAISRALVRAALNPVCLYCDIHSDLFDVTSQAAPPDYSSNRIFDYSNEKENNCVRTDYWVTSNIKRLRVTITFGPHIAGAPKSKCASRTPETLPCAVPRAEAPPRGVFTWCGAGPRVDVSRGPRKRGALGEGPARPPLRPALIVSAVQYGLSTIEKYRIIGNAGIHKSMCYLLQWCIVCNF